MTSNARFHPAHGRPDADPSDPATVALRLARSPEQWCRLVEHAPGERRYTRLPIAGSDAWVISWAPGTGLGLHDHGDAAGAMAVVAGTLVERHATRRVPGLLRTRVLDLGTVVAFGVDHVHEVTNAADEPAVSIHVYAPSLLRMSFYGDDPRDDRVVQADSATWWERR